MNNVDIEPYLKHILQRDVRFVVNDKVLREGKVIIFYIKDFYISFTLYTKKKQSKTYDIPLPYDVSATNNCLILDYSLRKIHRNIPALKKLIEKVSKSVGKKSKLYDNIMTIEYES
jgi:N-glycosylase/DNA lyase